MCDRRTAGDNSSWNAKFYHQYLQQHTRMTQWIQNLHQNIPQHWQNSLDSQNHAYHNCHPSSTCSHNDNQYQHQPICQHRNHIHRQRDHDRHQRRQKLHGNSRHDSRHETHHRTRSETNVEYVGDNESDVPEEDSENDGSDGEWVLNVEPFLAFRAANARSEKEKASTAEEEDSKSEESIELLDAILDENFKLIQLDDVRQMQKMDGKPSNIEVNRDFEYEREARILLYGEEANVIAALECSLEMAFNDVKDINQPIIFPCV